MNSSKAYYGKTYFDENDLKETKINHKVELEYYKTKQNTNDNFKYGIEIRKKEFIDNGIKIESNNIENISNNSDKVIEIINTLKKYKVTPIGLNDVLEELLKANWRGNRNFPLFIYMKKYLVYNADKWKKGVVIICQVLII